MSVSLQSPGYLAVWLEHLPTDRIESALSPRPDDPRVVVREVKSALRLSAQNAKAASLGLKLGMPLADARAMYPRLLVEHADDTADQNLLDAIADWASRYTPLVGVSAPNGVMLDITGCAHLFGGEETMRKDIARRLATQGFAARAAVAGTVGAAWGIARYGKASVVADEALRETLLPLPLATLRLDADQIDALARVGLKRIADIEGRPRAPLAARFGAILLRRLDQALGLLEEPITPRLPLPPYIAERCYAEPVTQEDSFLQTIEHLAGDLATRMEQRGDGARSLQVALYRVDGAVRRLSVATSKPLRDTRALCRLFKERFSSLTDELDPGFGFDLVRLSVTTAEKTQTQQKDIVSNANGGDDITHLIDRFGVRFGLRRVMRFALQETHIPEFAVVPAVAFPPPLQRGRGTVATATVEGGSVSAPQQDADGPTRPMRLFEHPEEIDAVAEVPDGPPAHFRWRRVAHEVARAEGPERIAMEWWRDDKGRTLTRDYFRVEDREGRRFWLYREGLYGRETARPRWFVHGVFA